MALPVTETSQEADFRRNFLCGIIREFMLKRFYWLAFSCKAGILKSIVSFVNRLDIYL